MERIKVVTWALATLLAATVASQAQNGGQNEPHGAMPGRQNQEPSTTGQGSKSGPPPTELAPGHNPATARDTHNDQVEMPPSELLKKDNDAGVPPMK